MVPTRGLLEADEKYIKFFGTLTLAAMLKDEEHRAVFYADDSRLREFALAIKNISCIDSQAILVNLHESHDLTMGTGAANPPGPARADCHPHFFASCSRGAGRDE